MAWGSHYGVLTPPLQICPVTARRRKLLRPFGCVVPVNSSSAGFPLSPAPGIFLHSLTSSMTALGIPTDPGKQLEADVAHPADEPVRPQLCCRASAPSERHIHPW